MQIQVNEHKMIKNENKAYELEKTETKTIKYVY